MDGVDRVDRRRTLKERLGLTGMSCCGATWGVGPTTITVLHDDDEEGEELPQEPQPERGQSASENGSGPECLGRDPSISRMNLAAALAAERNFRAVQDTEEASGSPVRPDSGGAGMGTPMRVSLMRLLEEADGQDGEMEKSGGGDSVCCVCMGRKKGAAFIPCGHTFCRVCSREVWLNRGCCPLCNRLILEILDIY